MATILDFKNVDSIGKVYSVDTATVIVKVDEFDNLRKLRVNQLIAIRSSRPGEHLIGLVSKITRSSIIKSIDEDDEDDTGLSIENILKVNLIGTLIDKQGTKENIFKRTLDTVPEIDAYCFSIDGEYITKFMSAISSQKDIKNPLYIGKYSISENAKAYLDGDKLFQRHAVIVGSTGSGKSWCIAKFIEQISDLPMANCILFDIHGEYSGDSFKKEGIQHLRIANPSDLKKKDRLNDGVLMLPYWLLTYEEMLAMLLDRSDSNAPNQAMLFSKIVFDNKKEFVKTFKDKSLESNITIDSPVPYELEKVIKELEEKDNEMVQGSKANTEKQGPFNGKLTRFIQRLDAKKQDRRLGFLFDLNDDELKADWMQRFCELLMTGTKLNPQNAGVKIIDFSEVPSDILPLIIGLVGRIIFSVQQWMNKDSRHPICLFCDEAHLYIPERTSQDSISDIGLKAYERIAKEGRKYGVSLAVISQRPAEVNRTVLSQCNNYISLRLTNAEDQSVIKKLLPDNLGGITDVLPILDIGEALVVGDASLLPTRIIIEQPSIKPQSATIDFWKQWSDENITQNINSGVRGLRKQSRS